MSLRTGELVKSYHGRRVVDGVSIHVDKGEVVGLLGKNGAGKTTTFYIVVGLTRPENGRVYLDDRDISRLRMHQRARLGIGYLPQDRSVFQGLNVEDNLRLVLQASPRSRSVIEERIDELIAEFSLEQVRKSLASRLSGGERRRVEIARALAVDPKYILLDEPFTGIDPLEVRSIRGMVARLRERGIGVLITDHNVRDTLLTTDRAYIMMDGRIIAEGTPQEIADNPLAREHYLGHDFVFQPAVEPTVPAPVVAPAAR